MIEDKMCVFQSGNYKVVYKSTQDVVRHRLSHMTQVVHMVQPEWHVDFWNMIVESWEDADNLIHQLSCLVRDVTEGEKNNGTL